MAVILLLISLCVTAYLYVRAQGLQKSLNETREILSGSLSEIAQLEIRARTLQDQLAESERVLREGQRAASDYEERILRLSKNEKSLQEQVTGQMSLLREAQSSALAYKLRIDRLSRYENLGTLEELDAELARLQEKAKELKEREKDYRKKIKEHIASANVRAQRIIEEANKRAEQIAGDAVVVARDFRQYEQAVTAMKNIIGGYGNQYIIPGQSLLDDLADVYGHTQAGEELKRARERVRQMVTDGTAAACDYVETSRKEIAITFVVDAFNGKADSVLSRSKRDNYGILRQEIIDAFTIVNLNGRAFRGARIVQEFLDARLEELKWACAAQEVRFQQADEQRRLKEQMREEEKARREFERAIKEAEKEENMLKKAMETVEHQIAEASEAQRVIFEAKLSELQEKLRLAEEKNKRAISMAQQTKSGHVYVISNIGSFGENIYKIGMTRRLEPLDRVKELSDASVPFDFDVHALIESDDAPGLENKLHRFFVLNRVNKVNHRREFFKANISEIRQQVEEMGISAHWTMLAGARQYFETLAIEKDLAENAGVRETWIRNQFAFEEQELQDILAGRDTEESASPDN